MVSVTRKVCLLGEFSVGKTSIARRYVTGTFTPDYHATLGVNIYKFADAWTSDEGQDIEANLLIWDIEGGELAPGLRESYITGAAGALVVGNISRAVTLEAMAGHAQTGLDRVTFRSLSSNVCYEGAKKWQRVTPKSFAVMRFALQRPVA